MKDWKTTLAGLLKAAAALLGIVGINFSPDDQNIILTACGVVYVLFSALQAYFTKDKEPNKK